MLYTRTGQLNVGFAAAVVVGVVPLVGGVGADAGGRLADGAGYRAAVLGTGPVATTVPEPLTWHLPGVVTGLATAAAAAVLALLVLVAGRLPARRRRPGRRAIAPVVLGDRGRLAHAGVRGTGARRRRHEANFGTGRHLRATHTVPAQGHPGAPPPARGTHTSMASPVRWESSRIDWISIDRGANA